VGLVPTSSQGSGGTGTVTSVTAGDTSIVIGGTAAAPTVETNTLDVIATDHPPAGNWSNNSHKITSIATATTAGDALPYGQAAGGSLAGTYPNPYAQDPLATGIGVLYHNFNPAVSTFAQAPSTGLISACAIGIPSGVVLTGIKMRIQVAAAGTNPTLVRAGLADNTGKVLVVSNDLHTTAFQATGVFPFPFTAQFTTAYFGAYLAMVIVVGTWGTTQPTISQPAGENAADAADGSFCPVVTQWAGQTDLPAVGSSITFQGANRNYYFGVY
jgi:hypothetical protein